MKVLMFARAREVAGAPRVEVDVPAGASLADLRRALAAAYPGLRVLLEKSTLAVDGEIVAEDVRLAPDAEIALLPPVSGG